MSGTRPRGLPSSRTDRTNRVVLSLLGLVLLLLGAAGLLLGSGVLGLQDRVLLGGPAAVEAYAVPGALALAALLALLGLRWALAQLRSDRVSALDLTVDRAAGETRVEGAVLLGAVEQAAEQVPGVEGASGRLLRRRGAEVLVLRVRLRDRADWEDVRSRLAAGPVAGLRTTLGDGCPHVRVELEPTGARPREPRRLA